MKTNEIYESPQKEAQIEKHGYTSAMCECCGKILQPDASKWKWFHASTSWKAVDTLEYLGDDGEQGFFPVGNSCAKKFPKEFIFTTAQISK